MKLGDANSLTDPLFRKRSEDKYIIRLFNLDKVIEEVEDRMEPYYPSKGTDYNLQRSVYYDSKDFKFLTDHLKDLNTRYKMRLRQYAPNGRWNQDAFLEVKYRIKGVEQKVRLRIDSYCETCIGSIPLPEKQMRKLNSEMSSTDFSTALSMINDISLKNEVSRITNVEYKRLSYKKGNIRVGIDTGIKVQPRRRKDELMLDLIKDNSLINDLKDYNHRYTPDINAVIEIKYPSETDKPTWFKDLMDSCDDPSTGFSKFVYSMSEVLT